MEHRSEQKGQYATIKGPSTAEVQLSGGFLVVAFIWDLNSVTRPTLGVQYPILLDFRGQLFSYNDLRPLTYNN